MAIQLIHLKELLESLVVLIDQFETITNRFKRVGYNMDIMRQSACLVVNHSGSGLRLNNGPDVKL